MIRCFFALCLLATVSAFAEDTILLSPSVPEFVESYCLECHDDLTTKGDRDFLPFLDDPNGMDSFLALEEILDSLNLGEMPVSYTHLTLPTKQMV